MSRKHIKKDRNQVVREDMTKNKEISERLDSNKKIFEQNVEDIPKWNNKISKLEAAYELEQEGDRIKLPGLECIDPKFEFERSKEWTEWQKKSVQMEIDKRGEVFKETKKQLLEQVEKLEKQNERIEKENSELTEALSDDKDNRAEYLG